jgi:hypothetical protein
MRLQWKVERSRKALQENNMAALTAEDRAIFARIKTPLQAADDGLGNPSTMSTDDYDAFNMRNNVQGRSRKRWTTLWYKRRADRIRAIKSRVIRDTARANGYMY